MADMDDGRPTDGEGALFDFRNQVPYPFGALRRLTW
jgi:hypothetical protein